MKNTYAQLTASRTYFNYDYMFKVAAYHYFGGDNKWAIRLKAQGIAESGLTMTRNSMTGAFGVMQVMPATFEWLTVNRMSIEDAYANIMAGSALMAYYYGKDVAIADAKGNIVKQMKGFRGLDIIPDDTEKWKFAVAGYNCGIGHITGKTTGKCCFDYIRKRGGDITLWESSAAWLPYITGEANAEQTITYVDRVTRYAGYIEGAHEQLV
jgi:soluble lytic murein transglycosylase-like protein